MAAPFERASVSSAGEIYGDFAVRVKLPPNWSEMAASRSSYQVQMWDEEACKFIEDAINEKLAREKEASDAKKD